MLFIFLGTILGVISVYKMVIGSYGDNPDFMAWFFFVLLGVMFGIVGLMIGFGLASLTGQIIPQRFNPVRVELVSIKDNVGIQGNFYLFGGYIDSKLTYFYYFKNKEGGYEKGQTDKVIIFEDEQTSPYLLTFESEFKNEIWNLIGIASKSKTAEAHIPTNSVFRDYELNLGK